MSKNVSFPQVRRDREYAYGEIEQTIIAPRLVGKEPNDPVFSQKDAVKQGSGHSWFLKRFFITPFMKTTCPPFAGCQNKGTLFTDDPYFSDKTTAV